MSPPVADIPNFNIEHYKVASLLSTSNKPAIETPYKNVIPIKGFTDSKYSLKVKEIYLFVEVEENYYVGTFSPLGIYCYGNSPLDVEEKLLADILDIYDHLINIPKKKLGKILKEYKIYLENTIEKKNG